MNERRRTATSNFGVSRRENHDATGFYARFVAPVLDDDATVLAPTPIAEPFVLGDARDMSTVADGSVALVVTSPPYFAGKQYEEELERDGIPSSYVEYLELLGDVFAECVRTLEPGGRIAVNVANLGRKPYRSLSADVIRILQDDLGLLIRGEIVWQKGEGASGSCAWGSFRSATNPVLRDLTERVIVASKGRFDRARSVKQREAEGLPHRNTILTEDFMALTLDVWNIPPESAKRVGHPAPFPVELPEQLIRLYTFEGDLVLDPFMGSGSSLVAAAKLGRRYVGYDLDEAYVDIARERVTEALAGPKAPAPNPSGGTRRRKAALSAPDSVEPSGSTATGRRAIGSSPAAIDVSEAIDGRQRAIGDGKAAKNLASELLAEAGFVLLNESGKRVPRTGVTVSHAARDATGTTWYFDVAGAFTSYRGGLLRMDTIWRSLGRAAALRNHLAHEEVRLVLLTSHLPKRGSEGDIALRAAGPDSLFDIISMLDDADLERLSAYSEGGHTTTALPGFWGA